jgi:Ca-activated chloride channel family protein
MEFIRTTGMKILYCLIAGIFLSACDGNPPSNSESSTELSLENTQHYYAFSKDYTWPDAQQVVSVAADVLAANYYLMIDGSGSMLESGCTDGRTKIDVAKEAVTAFVKKVPADANIGVLTFENMGISEKVALGKNRGQVLRAIKSIDAGNGTPLNTALITSFTAVEEHAKSQLGYGEYHIVIVTDGEANYGEDPRQTVYSILEKTPVAIHTIGFCIDAGHSLNMPGFTDYRSANSVDELTKGLSSVLAESVEYDMTVFQQ